MILLKNIFTVLLVVASFSYCLSQSTIESKPSEKYLVIDTIRLKSYKSGEFIESSIKIRALAQFAGNEYFIYLDHANDTAFSNSLRFYYSSIDSVIFWNDVCPLIGHKLYFNKQDSIVIYKYKYDRPNSADEESFLYCNPSFGLLGIDNYPWRLVSIYECKEIPDDINLNLESDILHERF
jgi:hypothetical protein